MARLCLPPLCFPPPHHAHQSTLHQGVRKWHTCTALPRQPPALTVVAPHMRVVERPMPAAMPVQLLLLLLLLLLQDCLQPLPTALMAASTEQQQQQHCSAAVVPEPISAAPGIDTGLPPGAAAWQCEGPCKRPFCCSCRLPFRHPKLQQQQQQVQQALGFLHVGSWVAAPWMRAALIGARGAHKYGACTASCTAGTLHFAAAFHALKHPYTARAYASTTHMH